MPKIKKKPMWLDRRVAKAGPYLTLCLSKKELDKATKKLISQSLEFPKIGAVCFTFTKESTDDLCAVVALSEAARSCNSIEIAGLLVHEAVHIWQAYAESIGERCPAAEQEAYAIQGISQELLAEYERRTQ